MRLQRDNQGIKYDNQGISLSFSSKTLMMSVALFSPSPHAPTVSRGLSCPLKGVVMVLFLDQRDCIINETRSDNLTSGIRKLPAVVFSFA